VIKRVYRKTGVRHEAGGFVVLLDDSVLRSPGRCALCLPTESMAQAIASEWDGQGEELDTTALRLTKLAGRAVDMDAAERAQVEDTVAGYVETDLVSHRAEGPPDLVAKQAAVWDPLLEWAMQAFSKAPQVTVGVLPVPTDASLAARYVDIVAGLDLYELVSLQALTSVTGSLVIALAVFKQELDADRAWDVSQIDETYRMSRWGDDPEAAGSRATRREDLNAAVRLLELNRALEPVIG
jgi:chaperone required for assembly of F1-ATPase